MPEIKPPLYRAFDRDYIPQSKIEELKKIIEEIVKLIAPLITNPGKNDFSGHKFHAREK